MKDVKQSYSGWHHARHDLQLSPEGRGKEARGFIPKARDQADGQSSTPEAKCRKENQGGNAPAPGLPGPRSRCGIVALQASVNQRRPLASFELSGRAGSVVG